MALSPAPAAPGRARRPRPRAIEQHIGGRWVGASTGATFDDLDPWSGEVLFHAPAGGADDAAAAVDAAAAAAPGWAAAGPGQRQGTFLRAADVVERRRAGLLDLLARETGAGRHFAGVQVDFALSLLRQLAGAAYAPQGQVLPSDIAGTTATAMRSPVGVVAAIPPWNASLILSGRAIAGAIALGNTVVLKPSEESPYTGGVVWAEVFAEAGLPAGVLNVVTHAPGAAGAVADELVANPAVRRINFTGSTPTGRRLAESAGRHLKRMVVQLSAQNPLVVLAGVDMGRAVRAAAYGAFVHQGEVCMCARRIYVEEPIAEEFAERLGEVASRLPVGDPKDPATVIGPLINRWALSMITRRVDEAVAAGARLLAGGSPQAPCYPATVVTDVPPTVELAFEETFGPVVVVDAVADADEAVARANSSRFSLSAGVLAGSLERAMAVGRRLEASIVHVNDQTVNDEAHMPFGGSRDSGWGRFGAGQAAEEFTELRWLTWRPEVRDLDL